MGGVQEVETEKRGAERRIPRAVGSGRNREKLCNIAQYLQLRKHKEAGANKNRTGTVRKFNPPPPLVAPFLTSAILNLCKCTLSGSFH